MTHNTYRILALLLVLAIVYDAIVNGGENLVFLGRKFVELIDWLIFWR
ncbi:MAG: hypothetical protein AAF429_15645 [Pseudomonadota bacterium]